MVLFSQIADSKHETRLAFAQRDYSAVAELDGLSSIFRPDQTSEYDADEQRLDHNAAH